MALTKLEDAAGIVVDCCPSCRGIWCQRGELEGLLGEHRDSSFLPLPFASGRQGGWRCPNCRDGAMEPRRAAGDASLELFDCLGCGGTWLDGGLLARLRKRLLARRLDRPSETPVAPRQTPRPSLTVDDHVPFDGIAIQALALPVAFLIGLIALLPELGVLVVFPVIMFHELGHAVGAWLAGLVAIPLPWGLTLVGGWSWLVVLGVSSLVGYLGWRSVREGKPFLLAFAGVMIILQLTLTFAVSREQAEMWWVFGGIGGEFLLTTLAIAGFYHPGPRRLRWDFWRFVFLVPAAVVFVRSTVFWLGVEKDPSQMPYGAVFGRDSEGDLDRLVGQWGWTPEEIVTTFLTLSLLCGWIIIGYYVFFLVRSLRQRPHERH